MGVAVFVALFRVRQQVWVNYQMHLVPALFPIDRVRA
jgi:hypothetical protein